MGYLTSQQRKHNVLVVSLLCVFVAILAGLCLWSLSLDMVGSDDGWKTPTTKYDSNNNPTRDERVEMAQAALDELNRQQKHSNGTVHDGCESTLLVMRHCDKLGPPVDDVNDMGEKHCSYLGFERAAFLPTLFGNSSSTSKSTTTSRWPTPSRLYALSLDRGNYMNYREWETLVPLSKKTGVAIELVEENSIKFANEHYLPHLLSGELCGKVAVVSWKHSFIPFLVNSLGCGPDNGCPLDYPEDSFDQVWQLKFVFRPPTIQFGSPDAGSGVTAANDNSNNNEQAAALSKESAHRRRLKNHHHYHHYNYRHQSHHSDDPSPTSGWVVYASVTNQFFDPLAFSKVAGDYPDEGSASGGRWIDEL